MQELLENLKKNFKPKWNLKEINQTTIARLISELEGACYILDCFDEEDYKILDEMRKKYYKIYFKLK